MSQVTERISLPTAQVLAEEILGELKKLGVKAEITGSILRKESEIGDIDIIVEGPVLNLASKIGVVLNGGNDRMILEYKGGLVNLFRCEPGEWGAMRLYLTGPKNYVIGYRMRAKRMNLTLNQHGLFDSEGKLVAAESEEEIYKALGKVWKSPELRGR